MLLLQQTIKRYTLYNAAQQQHSAHYKKSNTITKLN